MSSEPPISGAFRWPLRVWLALSHLGVLALALLGVLATGALARDLRQQTRWDLEHQGALVALLAASEVRHARETLPDAGIGEVSTAVSAALALTKAATFSGIEVTDPYGVVVASSGPDLGEDLSGRPEVQAAFEGSTGLMLRPRPTPRASYPLGSPSRRAKVRIFVAVPVSLDGELLGVAVLSRTPREEMQALYQMAPQGLLLGVLLSIIGTFALALVAGQLFTRSLGRLAEGSRRIAERGGMRPDDLALPTASHVREVGAVSKAVAEMAGRLEERLGYISEFAGNVAHEFKTPLSTLRGTLELLEDDEDMPPEQRARFLGNASAEIDRLERLVTGLLSLARAEEARASEVVDLDGLIDEAVGRSAGVSRRGSAGWARGSTTQLATVLAVLLDNARTHGGPDASIAIEAWTRGERTGFDVVDDGPGISEANLPRVFDRFFTTDRAGGGLGIGLALARAVCTAHGGEITVQSTPGRTSFRVVLPRAEREGRRLSALTADS